MILCETTMYGSVHEVEFNSSECNERRHQILLHRRKRSSSLTGLIEVFTDHDKGLEYNGLEQTPAVHYQCLKKFQQVRGYFHLLIYLLVICIYCTSSRGHRSFILDDFGSSHHPTQLQSLNIFESSKVSQHSGKTKVKQGETTANLATTVLDNTSEKEDCMFVADWQKSSRPNCNSLHELSLSYKYGSGLVSLVNRGGTRDVWKVTSSTRKDETMVVMKTLRLARNFDEKTLEQHRLDAMASEQLTVSQYVIDIFGYCAQSVLNEFADGGDANELFKRNKDISSIEKLSLATELAHGLADIHSIDGEGHATLVHGDIKPCNIMIAKGKFKYNDFNLGHMILYRKSDTTGTYELTSPCGFQWDKKCNQEGLVTFMRSPEECKQETDLLESVDTYSLGSLFYYLLTQEKPYRIEPIVTVEIKNEESNGDVFSIVGNGKRNKRILDQEEMTSHIINGIQATLPEEILKSSYDDYAIFAIIHALKQAWTYNAKDRPSSRSIAHGLEYALHTIQNLHNLK